jgi:hypothetical protein
MARSRNIKPGFFTNEDLVELDFETRLLFAGLWTVADRKGRLQDRPKKIKIDIFPADNVEVDVMLQELHDRKFIVRYVVNGVRYIQITNWSRHQNPHHTEKASVIPGVNGEITVKTPLEPGEPRKHDSGNLADSGFLIPDSLIKSPRMPRAASLEITLTNYLAICKTEGKKPIPADHAIRAYCIDAGITDEMRQIAWLVFKDRHLTNPKAKKYIDWPATFANSIKDRWYRLWNVNAEGHADWSPNGLQQKLVIETRMNETKEPDHAPA